LGSNLVKPASLVIDSRGIYFDTTRDNDLNYYLGNIDVSQQQLTIAKIFQKIIIAKNISKYNCQVIKSPNWKPRNKKIILIPGQVDDDASIKFGALEIKNNIQLLKKVRDLNKNAYIVYKPHPDVLVKNRKGFIEKNEVLKIADYYEDKCSIISCINCCDEVHTNTSLAGFEALIRNKKVFCYGNPFYSNLSLKDTFFINEKISLLKLIYFVFFKYQHTTNFLIYKKIINTNFSLNSSQKLNSYILKKVANLFFS
jgi:capsular polysaccharide export protein